MKGGEKMGEKKGRKQGKRTRVAERRGGEGEERIVRLDAFRSKSSISCRKRKESLT